MMYNGVCHEVMWSCKNGVKMKFFYSEQEEKMEKRRPVARVSFWVSRLLLVILLLIPAAVTADMVWEGNVAVSRLGELPSAGMYGASNAFPANSTITVENRKTGEKAEVLIVSRLENPNLFLMVSPQAADSLGMSAREIITGRVYIAADRIRPGDPIMGLPGDRAFDPESDAYPPADSFSPEELAFMESLYGDDFEAPPVWIEPEPSPAPETVEIEPEPAPEPDVVVEVEIEPEPDPEPVVKVPDKPLPEVLPEEEIEPEPEPDEPNILVMASPGEKAGPPEGPEPVLPIIVEPVETAVEPEPEPAPIVVTEPEPEPDPDRPGFLALKTAPEADRFTLPREIDVPEVPDEVDEDFIAAAAFDYSPRPDEDPEFERIAHLPAVPEEEEAVYIAAADVRPEADDRELPEEFPPELPPEVPEEPVVAEVEPEPEPEPEPEVPYPDDVEVVLIPAEDRPPEPIDLEEEDDRHIALEPEPPVQPEPPVELPEPPGVVHDTDFPITPVLETGAYYLQVGAFSKIDSAKRLSADLSARYPVTLVSSGPPEDPRYKVMVGPVNRDESGLLLFSFRSRGYRDAFIRVGN